MLIILIRTFILYIMVLVVIRIMGKAELSEMDPFQLVITFMVAELAALAIESPDMSLLTGIASLIALLFAQVLFSCLSLRFPRFQAFINGKPSILIEKGNINFKEMKKLRVSVDDLSEQLRLKNFHSIADVEYAIMELNGDLSVIPKPDKAPLTPSDINLSKDPEIMPVILIADGDLYKSSLKHVGLTMDQLTKKLRQHNVEDYKDVFICFVDAQGEFYVYPRKEGADTLKPAKNSAKKAPGSKK